MAAPTPREPLRANRRFLGRLLAELETWQRDGIISLEQAQSIIARYRIPPGLAGSLRVSGHLITILSIMGAIAVGVGIILFFAANWEKIDRPYKLALLLLGTPTVYGVGYWFRYWQDLRRLGTAIIFLATLFYGAAIFLVAQAYNSPVNDPRLFLYWFLGVIPLAYLTQAQAILGLGIGLFLAWIGFYLPGWLERQDAGKSEAVVLAFTLYLFMSLTLYGLGRLHAQIPRLLPYARVYETLGTLTALAAIYLLSFRFGFEDSSIYDGPAGFQGVARSYWVTMNLFAGLAVVVSVATGALRGWRRLSLGDLPYEAGAVSLFLAIGYLVSYFPVGGDLLYPVLFNAALLLSICGLLFWGNLRRRQDLISIALVFFGLDVLTRYFEYSWSYLDRSLVFIGAGLILLVGGYMLERGRRSMIQDAASQEQGRETGL